MTARDVSNSDGSSPGDGALPEGEETAPPGVRTMAIVRWVLVAVAAALAAGAWLYYADALPRTGRSATAAALYRCPMHPAVVQDRAGACPICGMDLVVAADARSNDEEGRELPRHNERAAMQVAARTAPSNRGPADSTTGKFWCPMHPEVESDDQEATCPKCGGMKLVPRDPKVAGKMAAASGAGAYWCPMHPEVTSDDPDATCPKCGGMRLLPRPGAASKPGGPVPGLVPVSLSPERRQLMGMRTGTVTRQRLAPELRTVGFVSTNEKHVAIVTSRVSGWVEELMVAQSGERVRKGDPLLTLFSGEVTTAQQAYLNAVRWKQNLAATNPGGLAPAAQAVDKDSLKRLQLYGLADVDIAELAKRNEPSNTFPIRAPVSGFVARKSVLPGLYVTAGTELFQIADLSTVWVVAEVYEQDMGRVVVGQKARLVLAAYPGVSFTGRVEFIYPALNPESRTLQARMEFRNPDLRLRPGMYGDVVFELGTSDVLTVPQEGVVDTGELQYVFVAREGGRFEPRVVRLGARGNDRVAVLEGVQEGETVVTTANFLLDSESRLRAAVEGRATELSGTRSP